MDRGRGFLLSLLVIVSLFVFLIIRPFLEYVLLGLILAYVLFPLHVRLADALERYTPIEHFSDHLSALTLIAGSLVAVVVPLTYVLVAFVADLQELAAGETGLETGVIETQLAEAMGVTVDLEEVVALGGEWLFGVFFGDVSGLFATILHFSLGGALLLFLVFYLLVDGPALVAWLTEASPLSPTVSETLIAQIDRTTWGAVVGHAFAAVVQALVAGIGFYVVGLPNVVFWTFVMVILAFLPLIGVFIVWAPAAGYLYLIGEPGAAAFLTLYGLLIVSFIDYYVRPIVIDSRAQLNPAVILIGVFGGVYTLGFVGLFVGPILIGVLVAIVETFRTEYYAAEDDRELERPQSAETGAVTSSFEESEEHRTPQ
ncbi:AI-2E family transporter [Natrononativus amylolyticus]|uniref:AI-2E family transporter n=1 Tax=Natrononativus amylolyticus TaxID=2963434 RepID=UPI0020CE740F|nr:AI-2E family transporter [Natrononativus amylolyticus]